MKKFLLLVSVLLSGAGSFGQSGNQDLAAMVETERAFAKLAIDKNTREAFLTYLTDKTITFQKGPVVGLKGWEESKADDSELVWGPDCADMAASGDFGYTTGYSLWRAHRGDVEAGYYGEFISVWQKNESGTWKNMLDIGVPHGKPGEIPAFKAAATSPMRGKKKSRSDFNSELIKEERIFISNAGFGWSVYKDRLSAAARVYRNNYLPFLTPGAIEKAYQESGSTLAFKPIGWSSASSGDLGYVYGTVVILKTVDGKPVSSQANYVRIWKKEGRKWKIVVDVLANW